MGYGDKYPDMSALYELQFREENKLKDKIKELENELERTRKALDVANVFIMNYAKEKLEQKEEQ